MLLALSPIRSLFQIARRRSTSKIFTIDILNVVTNLLTSDTLILKSHGKTHSVLSVKPNVHLEKGLVRATNKYI